MLGRGIGGAWSGSACVWKNLNIHNISEISEINEINDIRIGPPNQQLYFCTIGRRAAANFPAARVPGMIPVRSLHYEADYVS